MSTDADAAHLVRRLHVHQTLEARCIDRGSPYRTVIHIGGVGSGKTFIILLWLLMRMEWDTAQMHAVFASTSTQLHAILGEVLEILENHLGITHVIDRKPPAEWRARWIAQGIKVPPRVDKYRGVMVFSCGLHLYCGAYKNKAYRQVKGWKFGSVLLEEIQECPYPDIVSFMRERMRCGLGPERCKALHLHVLIVHGNVPDDDGHWIYFELARLVKAVAKAIGAPVPDSPDDYSLLMHGRGNAIYIRSSTATNRANLPETYESDIAEGTDEETAKRVLGGVLGRRRVGRAYYSWDSGNVHPVRYDPNRTLYLFFDFNANPTVCGLAHPLEPDEVPEQHRTEGGVYEGVFGEFFHIGGMDVDQMCRLLASGKPINGTPAAGSDGYLPPNWNGIAQHKGRVIAFGDAKAGGGKAGTPFNGWTIVSDVLGDACRGEDRGGFGRNVPKENPLQQVRVRTLNGRLCNAAGKRFVFVDPHLTRLSIDLDTVQTEADGTIKKPGGPRPGTKVWLLTHISDGMGYWQFALHPMGRNIDPNIEKHERVTQPRINWPSLID